MSNLVGNPEDGFTGNTAHISLCKHIHVSLILLNSLNTVMIVGLGTVRSGKTVKTQISSIRILTVRHFICIFWTNKPIVWPRV